MKSKILLILALAAILPSCSGGEGEASENGGSADRRQAEQRGGQEPQARAISVRAHQVERQPISTYIIANTTLESIREVTVYSKLNSIVSELGAEEGDFIREGQLLVRLEDREIRNDFDQARIAVDQSQVQLEQAKVRSELSEASYDRARSLFEQKLMSREEFDQAALVSRTDSLGLESAQEQLQAARARLEAAEIQLGYTGIYSPISGTITERLIDVGDRVNVNEAVYTVQEFPPLWARIFVPEVSLTELSVGQQTRLNLSTYPDRFFQGRIKMISPTVDASSGTVKVTIEVQQDARLLRPGMFGTVYIATETREDAVVVPKKAVIRERDQNFVFVVNQDSTVTRRLVETGFTEGDLVEVVAGIQPDETVVTVGVETLSDGYPVMVQNLEQQPGEQRAAAPREQPAQLAARQGRSSEAGAGSTPGPGGRLAQAMSNPEFKKIYETRLKEDPSIAEDPEKRRTVVREIFSQLRAGANPQ